MSSKKIVLVSLLATALFGCARQAEEHHIVAMPDVSASIEPKAEEEVFKAIEDLVGRLNRGDRITIIPILGDAQAEVSGRILRFEVPRNRQAYDSDLRHFAAKVRNSLEELKSSAMKHPGTRTDILGSISLAEQEFQSDSRFAKRSLVVLSDFIQEDSEFNFRRDRRLCSQTVAKDFAEQVAKRDNLDLRGISVYLGLLRSREYADLSRSRRATIQVFWITYFTSLGGKPTVAADGPGLLNRHE